jgi:hypothetical protein
MSFHSSTAHTQILNIDYRQLDFVLEQQKLQSYHSATSDVIPQLGRILTSGYDSMYPAVISIIKE